MGTDNLDELLDNSRPRTTPITPGITQELQRLRAATAAIARRRWARPVVAGLAATILISGGAAAAAATGTWTLPWAENDALATFSYTLPSGIECEQRVGGVTGTVPAVIEATENFYRTTDIQALLTPDAITDAIENQRSGEPIHILEDGTTVPGGYGTDYYNADQEYMTAVINIVFTAMDDELARQGLTGVDRDASLQSEPSCPGLDLYGSRP